MGMIKPILFLFLFFCKQKGIKYDDNNLLEQNISIQQDSAIVFLTNFYSNYIKEGIRNSPNEKALNSLKEKYLSKKFLSRLSNKELDYDPVINAQDFIEQWLETMNIEPLVKGQFYKVCLPYNDFEGNHNLCMKVKLEKTKEGYLIDNIEEYKMKEEITGQIEQKNIVTSWKGKYVYLAYDRDNYKNEYKINIKSYEDVRILNIIDNDTIKYKSKIISLQTNNGISEIALPLISYQGDNKSDVDTLYLKKEKASYFISGNPIYEINPGNNTWSPLEISN
ncbi:DUF3828 domain-containing protein [Apibacter adventoris]|uniref:DUF3828 domain-containing protein n=1 Tax=Apibacter adventoris TaxID=1679466 RepID=A0A2S8ADZ8_9FLAO|nr:DUF3828 domain-containing protein [Apibacter adventoris]PQL93159.1 hypothetical protein C4S77_05735 [Apibacter adventoris]